MTLAADEKSIDRTAIGHDEGPVRLYGNVQMDRRDVRIVDQHVGANAAPDGKRGMGGIDGDTLPCRYASVMIEDIDDDRLGNHGSAWFDVGVIHRAHDGSHCIRSTNRRMNSIAAS